jgi:prophage regulatory protein
MTEFPNAALEILRRQVEAQTGLSRSTIYQKIKERTFPLPISLGANSVGWIKTEIDEWLAARVKLSRGQLTLTNTGDNAER